MMPMVTLPGRPDFPGQPDPRQHRGDKADGFRRKARILFQVERLCRASKPTYYCGRTPQQIRATDALIDRLCQQGERAISDFVLSEFHQLAGVATGSLSARFQRGERLTLLQALSGGMVRQGVNDRLSLLAVSAPGSGKKVLSDLACFVSRVNDLSQPEQAETARAIAQIYAAYLNPEGFSLGRAASVGLYRAGRIGDMIAGDQSYLTGYFGSKQARALRTMADAYLIAERNKRFLRAMKSYLDQGGALVAVGAFHLPGKDGLIEALRADGYRVERVPTAGEDG